MATHEEPTLDLGEEFDTVSYEEAIGRRSNPEVIETKRAKKRRKSHLKAMKGYEVTPAQRLMRDEMSRPQEHSLPSAFPDLQKKIFGEPKPLSKVLEEVMHPNSDLTSVALDVIAAGPNLNLSFQQWVIVQGLIEAGVNRGYDLGLAACR